MLDVMLENFMLIMICIILFILFMKLFKIALFLILLGGCIYFLGGFYGTIVAVIIFYIINRNKS